MNPYLIEDELHLREAEFGREAARVRVHAHRPNPLVRLTGVVALASGRGLRRLGEEIEGWALAQDTARPLARRPRERLVR